MAGPWEKYSAPDPTPGEDVAPGPWQQYVTSGPKDVDPISHAKEADIGMMDRFLAGIKTSPAGVKNFLKERGHDVLEPEPGKFFIKQEGKYLPMDHPDLKWSDLLDLGGEAINILPSVAGSIAGTAMGGPGGGIAGAGLGGAAGSAARQAISKVLPGDDEQSLGGMLQDVALDTVAGAAGEKAGQMIAKGVNYMRPRNYIARQYAKPYAQESADIARKTGMDFLPGEATGSQTL